jgi:hypothetical protein
MLESSALWEKLLEEEKVDRSAVDGLQCLELVGSSL